MNGQHGEVQICCENNIIRATLIGSFNEEGAIKYTEGIKDIVRSLEGQKYAILVDNLNMEGGTPEAYQVLEQYNQWLNGTNLVGKAIIVKTLITTELIKSLSPSIKLQTTKSFKNRTLAIQWLQSLMT